MKRCPTLCFLLLGVVSPAAPSAGPTANEVAAGVHLVPGTFEPGRQPDGNTVILVAPEGLVVVDTGRHAEHTRRIADFAAAAEKPVAVVINTHWHLDHIGGNARLRSAFPQLRVHASDALERALEGFLATYRRQLQDLVDRGAGDAQAYRTEIALIDTGPTLAPDEVIGASGPRRLAGRDLEIGLARRAVTEGDVWLFDPQTRVLVAGDLVTLPAPFLDTACPQGWLAALERLARIDFAVLVPGHGPPMVRDEFEAYRAALAGFVACARTESPAETCASGWLEALGALAPQGERAQARSLLDYYVGLLRGDPARESRLCGE